MPTKNEAMSMHKSLCSQIESPNASTEIASDRNDKIVIFFMPLFCCTDFNQYICIEIKLRMISTNLFNCSRKGLYRRPNFKPQLWSWSLSLYCYEYICFSVNIYGYCFIDFPSYSFVRQILLYSY